MGSSTSRPPCLTLDECGIAAGPAYGGPVEYGRRGLEALMVLAYWLRTMALNNRHPQGLVLLEACYADSWSDTWDLDRCSEWVEVDGDGHVCVGQRFDDGSTWSCPEYEPWQRGSHCICDEERYATCCVRTKPVPGLYWRGEMLALRLGNMALSVWDKDQNMASLTVSEEAGGIVGATFVEGLTLAPLTATGNERVGATTVECGDNTWPATVFVVRKTGQTEIRVRFQHDKRFTFPAVEWVLLSDRPFRSSVYLGVDLWNRVKTARNSGFPGEGVWLG